MLGLLDPLPAPHAGTVKNLRVPLRWAGFLELQFKIWHKNSKFFILGDAPQPNQKSRGFSHEKRNCPARWMELMTSDSCVASLTTAQVTCDKVFDVFLLY